MSIQTSLNDLQKKVAVLEADKRSARKTLKRATAELNGKKAILIQLSNIQTLIQATSKVMYDNLSIKLGNVITEGLALIFPESSYRFEVKFVERRNTIETDLFLVDDAGNVYDPVNDVGGGVADLIALLLRMVYITLSPYENVLFADEPLKFINRGRIPIAAKFIQKICQEFRLEMVAVTHIPEMVEVSNSAYEITKTSAGSVAKKIV